MKDRVVVGTIDYPDCIVKSRLSSNLEASLYEDLEISFEPMEDFPQAIAELSDAKLDVIALPANIAISFSAKIAEMG